MDEIVYLTTNQVIASNTCFFNKTYSNDLITL